MKNSRKGTRAPQRSAQQAQRKQPPKAAKPRRRRRGSNVLYYILIMLTAIAIGIGLSLTVFFKMETVLVEGNTHYQEQAILDTADIPPEENLFRLDSEAITRRLVSSYPYVEKVKVKRKLPSTAVITITEAEPLGYFLQEDGSYVLVSKNSRVLQVGSGEPTERYLQINGVTVENVSPCQQLPEKLGESMTMFRYLSEAVDTTGFTDITTIDLSDRLNIRIIYQDRLLIELGSEGDLVDKLDFALYAIREDIPQAFEGVLDVTIPKQIRFRPEEIHSDPNYHPNIILEPETPEGEEVPTETPNGAE